MRLSNDSILVIGDTDRQVQSAVLKVLPGAHVTSIPGVFDGIAELAGGQYSAVLAAAEPIERHPEAAVRPLRQLAGKARLMLFGHPTLEPLSRKMLNFGVDDYLITPSSPEELQQMFGAPALKLSSEEEDETVDASAPGVASRASLLHGLPIAHILLDAMLQFP